MHQDFFGIEKELSTQLGVQKYFSLFELTKKKPVVKKLPYSIRILLENVIRNYDGFAVTEDHLNTVLKLERNCKSKRHSLLSGQSVNARLYRSSCSG